MEWLYPIHVTQGSAADSIEYVLTDCGMSIAMLALRWPWLSISLKVGTLIHCSFVSTLSSFSPASDNERGTHGLKQQGCTDKQRQTHLHRQTSLPPTKCPYALSKQNTCTYTQRHKQAKRPMHILTTQTHTHKNIHTDYINTHKLTQTHDERHIRILTNRHTHPIHTRT